MRVAQSVGAAPPPVMQSWVVDGRGTNFKNMVGRSSPTLHYRGEGAVQNTANVDGNAGAGGGAPPLEEALVGEEVE